jgi:hypothetical protein
MGLWIDMAGSRQVVGKGEVGDGWLAGARAQPPSNALAHSALQLWLTAAPHQIRQTDQTRQALSTADATNIN